MWKTFLADKTGRPLDFDTSEEPVSLAVATRPQRVFKNRLAFFSNDEHGIDMNVDASIGGTPVAVHDGTDTALWTATSIQGTKFTFDSTDRSNDGTKSIKIDNPDVDDTLQLDKGSDLDCTGYVSLSMYINVDKDWNIDTNIEIYGYDTGLGQIVGTAVSLQDYFVWNDFDVWQKIVIPLTDFGELSESTTLDALRIKIVATNGKAPKFYLDTIQFEQTGTPVSFIVQPPQGLWYHIKSFQILMADAHTGIVENGTMPNIPYNKFLTGSALVAGLNYQRISEGIIEASFNIKKFIDFMILSNATITGYGSDGTNSWVSVNVRFTEPVILKSESYDKMSLTIAEDLTDLLFLRVGAGCKEEERRG